MTTGGTIITFYSYKGGVGRSMALANIGVLLAQWGYRTLLVDLDLEAPGLEYFFLDSFSSVEDAQRKEGALELLSAAFRGDRESMVRQLADVPQRLTLRSRPAGSLELIPAGRRDDGDYFGRVRELDARSAYAEHNAGWAIEDLRAELKARYDFVLIDSRTGNTEIGGLTTVQLPDVLCVVFTTTEQALRGSVSMVARAAAARQRLPLPRPVVPVLPLPSRMDVTAEYRLSQEWYARMSREFEPVMAPWLPVEVRPQLFFEKVKLPQVSYFGYGERLPVLEQGTSDPVGLGYAYASVAALLSRRVDEVSLFLTDREQYVSDAARARRPSEATATEPLIFLSYSRADAVWAQRLAVLLKPLLRGRRLTLWSDTEIREGGAWTAAIEEAIQRASVFVPLVSADYLASDYIMEQELPAILARDVPAVPVLIGSSLWTETELARYPVANSEPLNLMVESGARDQALVQIVQRIVDVAVRVA